MFQNHWQNCEFCTPSFIINRENLSSLLLRLGLFTSTFGRLNSCTLLLLFEVLREILSQCLISYGICSTTLSVNSVIVNYICWKCLLIPDIFLSNKSSIIKKTFHWLSSTRTPKVVKQYIMLNNACFLQCWK